MSATWSDLAVRAMPAVLVLVWFLALIGGFSLGGLVHLLLVAAAALFAYQAVAARSA